MLETTRRACWHAVRTQATQPDSPGLRPQLCHVPAASLGKKLHLPEAQLCSSITRGILCQVRALVIGCKKMDTFYKLQGGGWGSHAVAGWGGCKELGRSYCFLCTCCVPDSASFTNICTYCIPDSASFTNIGSYCVPHSASFTSIDHT